MALTCRPLAAADHAAWLDFFGTTPEFDWCFCTYWDFAGDNRAWIRRAADENRQLRAEGLAGLQGVLAYDGTTPVGWCRLLPRTAEDKLAEFYGPPPAPDTWAIGCFCVRVSHRNQGCARALLDAAVAHARTLGARRLEGFPRPESTGSIPDGEAWTGPARLYAAAGFTITPHGEHRAVATLEL